jgi:hypothetical protein
MALALSRRTFRSAASSAPLAAGCGFPDRFDQPFGFLRVLMARPQARPRACLFRISVRSIRCGSSSFLSLSVDPALRLLRDFRNPDRGDRRVAPHGVLGSLARYGFGI